MALTTASGRSTVTSSPLLARRNVNSLPVTDALRNVTASPIARPEYRMSRISARSFGFSFAAASSARTSGNSRGIVTGGSCLGGPECREQLTGIPAPVSCESEEGLQLGQPLPGRRRATSPTRDPRPSCALVQVLENRQAVPVSPARERPEQCLIPLDGSVPEVAYVRFLVKEDGASLTDCHRLRTPIPGRGRGALLSAEPAFGSCLAAGAARSTGSGIGLHRRAAWSESATAPRSPGPPTLVSRAYEPPPSRPWVDGRQVNDRDSTGTVQPVECRRVPIGAGTPPAARPTGPPLSR